MPMRRLESFFPLATLAVVAGAMSGERTERMIELAALGAARLSRRMLIVNDRFGAESPVQEELELRLEDATREFDEVGHLYDPDCQRPFCVTARAMLAQALSVVQGQGAA